MKKLAHYRYFDVGTPPCAELRLGESYAKGQQVFLTYGTRSNSELALDYGFVLPNNEHDSVQITLPLEADGRDPLALRKQSALDKAQLPRELQFAVCAGGMIPDDAIRFARIAVSQSDKELQGSPATPLSKENEARARRFVRRAVQRRLSAYSNQSKGDLLRMPLSTADQVACEIPPASRKEEARQMASILVKGEKDILHKAIDALK
mmetsp:Transcript_33933/g.54981  ORF Transcript_33933/g.54981 Transcript_33933/m.54981 type:complete len:207 (+) Transcript_33933:917-1537(+)